MIRRRNPSENAILDAFDPPVSLIQPDQLSSPLIFASPHSGSVYPSGFIEASMQPLHVLRRNEDAFIDTLFECAAEKGAPLLTARFPRCFVDVNRAPDELPRRWRPGKTLSTTRAEMGLGVIPTMISDKLPIYKRAPKASIVAGRLNTLYHPYHHALRQLIDEAKAVFGHAIVIDCHSMPGFTLQGSRRSDIILGDRYGVSCYPETLAFVDQLFSVRGYGVTRNYPYAGGYVASHYGRPRDGVEVVQIEINRDLYLNPVTLERKRGYARLSFDIKSIVNELISGFADSQAEAAE